ncbi:hypothetical protein Hypma_006054, partial [Hypsizygus marmoreus]
MRANAVAFASPMIKVYDILPPPIDELDEVLAFIYTGYESFNLLKTRSLSDQFVWTNVIDPVKWASAAHG